MKKIQFLILFVFLPFLGKSQLDTTRLDSNIVDSLMRHYIDYSTNSGSTRFNPYTLKEGELFSVLANYLVPNNNYTFHLETSKTDKYIFQKHNTYSIYYRGIPIEGAEVIEHCKNGWVVRISGKTTNFEGEIDGHLTMADALNKLQLEYEWEEPAIFAWEDQEWEEDLKLEYDNPDTSYFPTENGQLVWATVNYRRLGAIIPDSCIKLAWKFTIVSLNPVFTKEFYVDAFNGKIISIRDLFIQDGPANIFVYGDITLDTRYRGWPNYDHYLYTNGGNTKVHTKSYFGNKSPNTNPQGQSFNFAPEITDSDDDWGTDHQFITSAHWMATKAWEYFEEELDHQGFKGNGNSQVKVRADGPLGWANTGYDIGKDQIMISKRLNGDNVATMDVVAHEFSHGVAWAVKNFEYWYETGAIMEAYGDMFGILAERYIESQYYPNRTFDWFFGEDIFTGFFDVVRDLENPQSNGFHYDPLILCNQLEGQPDTYFGDFWYDPDMYNVLDDKQCDNAGVHVNCTVITKWFQLLIEGGSLNDVNVLGMGFDKTEELIFEVLQHGIKKKANFEDLRDETIEAAKDLFGECSVMVQSVSDAWDAVEVPGLQVNCFPQGIPQTEINKTIELKLYPNPSQDKINIQFSHSTSGQVLIYSSLGTLIKNISLNSADNFLLEHNFNPGIYFFNFVTKETTITKTFIVQ